MYRNCYFDNLKVFLIILVIFDHAAITYTPFNIWPYTPSHPEEFMPNMWVFLGINSSFIMSLFFFMSAYFFPISYEKQGFITFMKRKVIRLGIPLLLFVPIHSYVLGKYEVGHLWYIESLLIMAFMYGFYRLSLRKSSIKLNVKLSFVYIFVICFISGYLMFVLRQFYPYNTWVNFLGFISIEPAHYPLYVVMLISGILAMQNNWMDHLTDRIGFTCLFLAVISALILPLYGVYEHFKYANSRLLCFHEAYGGILANFGFLWLFKKYVNKSGKFLNMLSQNSYGAYFFHLPVLFGVQYLTDSIAFCVELKYLSISILTALISFFLTWLIRKNHWVRYVF